MRPKVLLAAAGAYPERNDSSGGAGTVPPVNTSTAPPPNVRDEIENLLRNDGRQLGAAYRAVAEGSRTARDLAEKGVSKNLGVNYRLLATLNVLTDGTSPRGAERCRSAAHAIGEYLEDTAITAETREYLSALRERLFTKARSQAALRADVANLENDAGELAVKAERTPGVYVYSFRHYLRHPNDTRTGRCWLKIGSTTQSAWRRVIDQSRMTSMPEDPKLLRIYHSPTMEPAQIEDCFHRVLDAAGHERSSSRHSKAGIEWFSTTLELLDTVADVMGIDIDTLEPPE
jgi:hypothetical protein